MSPFLAPASWCQMSMMWIISWLVVVVLSGENLVASQSHGWIHGCGRGKSSKAIDFDFVESPQPLLQQEGFQLRINSVPVSTNEGSSSSSIIAADAEDTPRVVVLTKQTHVLKLTWFGGRSNVFRDLMVRIEGGTQKTDVSSSLKIGPGGVGSQQLEPLVPCGGDALGAVRLSSWARESGLSSLSLELRIDNEDFNMPLEIMVVAQASSGNKPIHLYSRLLIDAVDDDDSKRKPSLLRHRRLNDVPNNPSPTTSPTSPPTRSPTGSPTVSPTKAPTRVPTVAPTQSPTVSPTKTPTASPSALPTATPTSRPSRPPTASPTSQPSPTPTRAPSPVPSAGPTKQPTRQPTAGPTARPTRQPTAAPTQAPTRGPTATPTQSPTASPQLAAQTPTQTPTSQPTTLPTPTGVVRTGEIVGAKITLDNVGELDPGAQVSFESAMDSFLAAVYPLTLRRELRQLQVDGVTSVTAQTFFKAQEPAETNNTILYDLSVTYKTFDASIALSDIVSQPFENAERNRQFRDRLRNSHAAFASVPDTAIAKPLIAAENNPEGDGSGGGDDGFGLGIIVGIASGAALFISLLILFIFRASLFGSDKDNYETTPNAPLAESGGSVRDTDDDGPPETLINRPGGVLGYADQSISTLEYDYAKAYGGGGIEADHSIVSSAPGTLGTYPDDPSAARMLGQNGDDESPFIREEIFEINAPSGKLGVVIDTPDHGPPVVHAVKDSSVLVDQIQVGDKLLKVDEEDVSTMTAVKVSKLISRKAANATRKFTLMRRVVVDD